MRGVHPAHLVDGAEDVCAGGIQLNDFLDSAAWEGASEVAAWLRAAHHCRLPIPVGNRPAFNTRHHLTDEIG